MTTTHVSGLDATVHKTNVWLKELKQELGQENDQLAYAALRGTLHAIRDRLSIGETADFASHLPALLRGVYYDGWVPEHSHAGLRTRDSFLGEVRDAFRPAPGDEPSVPPEEAVRAVARVLERHVPEGQMDHVRVTLPGEIRELVGGEARS